MKELPPWLHRIAERHPLAEAAGIAILLLAALMSVDASAQTRAPSGGAVMTGTVRDSATGYSPLWARVCARVPSGSSAFEPRCAAVDSLGNYYLDALPLRRMQLSVTCIAIFGTGKGFAVDSIAFTDTVVLRRDWIVPLSGCDPRPRRRVTGTFRGHYTRGFELSEFVLCAADAWPNDSLGAYPGDARRAWVTWPDGAMRGIVWPVAPRGIDGTRWYVRWRGTIVGPGRYGHMDVSPFELVVDTIFELRAPREQDCR